MDLDRHLWSGSAADQVGHAADQSVEIDGRGLERLPARKGEETLDQRLRALRRL